MKKSILRTFLIFLIIVTIPFPAYADFGAIQIDGYYDDWEDKPHTEVYPGNNHPASKINYVSLFRDESNAYIHVIFAHKNNQDIKNMTINLYTNLGDENYFIVPDSFNWSTETDSSESDQSPNQSIELESPDQEPNNEEEISTEPGTETNDPGGETEPVDQNADTNEQSTNTDEGNGSESDRENLFANSITETILLVADNEDKSDKKTETDTLDTEGIGTDNSNEETDNGQGNDTDTTDTTDTNAPDTTNNSGPEIVTDGDTNTEEIDELLDLFDPENNIDLDMVLDQFVPDITTDSGIEMNPTDPDEMNSNLDLKKPGQYGTWGFSVWDGPSPVGSGYYTRTQGEPDELELYIPLSSITPQYDGITEISMKIKKLGPQIVMSVGASSEPYIIVAIGAGIAMLSAGAYSYKKKRPFLLNNTK